MDGAGSDEGGDAPRIVVSVHDVAPSTATQVRWLLARLDDAGVTRRVLNVIPNEGGTSPVDKDVDLAALLRREIVNGSEVVLHGYAHRSSGRPRGAASARMRARLFARGSAEFMSLPPDVAAEHVATGLATLQRIGLHPTGFCPPGWLADRGLARILQAAGLRYLVTYFRLIDLRRGASAWLPGFGYMGSGDMQEPLVAIEGGYVLLARRSLPVIRVFLHPQGASSSSLCARTLNAVERLRRERRPVTFTDLLGERTELGD